MQEEIEKLAPLYFHWREVPKCAYYDFDDLTTDKRLDEATVRDMNLMFPKNMPISAEQLGPDGCMIRKRNSPLVTILSSDPDATLDLNGWRIFLGAGSFTFPTAVLGAVELRLFHQGAALVEYRAFSQQYADDLRDLQFNYLFQDADKKDVVGGCCSHCTAPIKAPLLPLAEGAPYGLELTKTRIARLKEAGLLFDAP